jgi:type I restriction enzyme S subunit
MDILNLKILRQLPIAFPPLAEQKRIVARVDELLRLCDEMVGRLREAQEMRRALVESSTHL